MTKRDIAGYLNIDRSTLYNWEKNKPNLYKTIMQGLAVNDIVKKAQENADEIKELSDKFSK